MHALFHLHSITSPILLYLHIEPPEITEMVFNLGPEVITGNMAEIQCTAFGVPAPNISWEMGGSVLTSSGHVTITEGGSSGNTSSSVLLISNVSLSDNGTYTCVAENGVVSSDTMTLELIVLGKP